MSMFSACCCAAKGPPSGCLGCETEPESFRLDFPEITYKSASLTASAVWDNGLSSCENGYRWLSASREFPDISDFGNGTILTRETAANTPCAWGFCDATVWGERLAAVRSGTRCDCSTATASIYGGAQLGDKYADWDAIGVDALNAQIAARPTDCGDTGSCGFLETNEVTCQDVRSRLGMRCFLGASETHWILNLQWRQISNITWRLFSSFGGTGLVVSAIHGNFAARDFNGFFGANEASAYDNVFTVLWPDTTTSQKSRADLQWSYSAPRTCSDLDGSPFVLTLIDQANVNQRFANNYINNPPASVTLVAS